MNKQINKYFTLAKLRGKNIPSWVCGYVAHRAVSAWISKSKRKVVRSEPLKAHRNKACWGFEGITRNLDSRKWEATEVWRTQSEMTISFGLRQIYFVWFLCFLKSYNRKGYSARLPNARWTYEVSIARCQKKIENVIFIKMIFHNTLKYNGKKSHKMCEIISHIIRSGADCSAMILHKWATKTVKVQ